MPIRLLPPDVSSKIAAGEVVDRPASVVKELLENSLDAGATEISIEVRAGGIEHIRLADNGAGIPSDEVELAFQRFATSKVSGQPDLEAISTLGFRGEALPSIAAVSKVSLVTRSASEDFGTRAEVADSQIISRRREGAAPGTVITVRQLFRNFPARRKFLRTAATEASGIRALVTRYALAYPAVQVHLDLDGSFALRTSGSGDLREAIADVYRPEIAHPMLELMPGPGFEETGGPLPSGMIGPASLTRPNRSYISVFVNGRWVQSRSLGFALEQAYKGFLMERRFPVAVVNIALPYDEVDVNVHPSKTDVRLRQQGLVFSTLQQAVRHTLTAHSPVPELTGTPELAAHHPTGPRISSYRPSSPAVPTANRVTLAAPSGWPEDEPAQAPEAFEQPQPLIPQKALPALRVLGQAQTTYITAEGPDGVYLIDQHAAHERVLFERVQAEAKSQRPEVQGLMEPVTVELDPRQSELLESQRELIAQLGFSVETFGGPAYILRGVPSVLADGDPAQSLAEVLDLMADGGGFDSWEERAAYSIACHGAVRAGKALSQQEMTELTRQLESCRQPHTCPHGRPTMIHLSTARLEREFGRR